MLNYKIFYIIALRWNMAELQKHVWKFFSYEIFTVASLNCIANIEIIIPF